MFQCQVLILAGNLLLFSTLVFSQQQSFVSLPADTEVVLGQTTVLSCRVSNQAGNVQWTKDGVLMGYNRAIPGYPRYSMVGDASLGVHNLQIENAQFEDEGEYQCQVSPIDGHLALSGTCHLIVLLPATSIEICDRANGSKVRLHQSESLTLVCEVKGGKPAATISWYRNSHKLRQDAAEVEVSDEEEEKRQTARSTLTLHPLPSDNGVAYMCEGSHPALARQLRFSVLLDVLFPPGRPLVEGYHDGDPVRMGDTVPLRCVSRGGNPLAQLVWKKNGEIIDFSYITSDWESINTLSITADASDNGAVYICEASSMLSSETMVTSVTFTVLYSPAKVTVSGPQEAKAGDTVTLTCTTDRSNPASEVSWVVDGRPVSSANEVEAYEGGGWTTSAQITVNITYQERNAKLFSCYAVNRALGETVVDTFSISILYAPDPPAIFGYLEGSAIRAGSLQRLTCVSHGGNPLPTLKWFKGDTEVEKVQVTSNGNVVSGEITIIAADNDNGGEYRCETSSTAIPDPLTATIILTVHFPPSAVLIKMKPKKPKAGHKVALICESNSSNPPANVTWWRDGDQMDTFAGGVSPGSHGGTTTRSMVVLNVTEEDDKSILTCQATNYALQQSVHDAVTLSIQYKPKFPVADRLTEEISEGDPWLLNITCQANPSEVTYVWTKNNETVWEGSVVNISSVRRNDSGEYVCKATNDIGTSRITVFLQVKYAVTVRAPKEFVLAERGSDPQLVCLAEGYPLPDDVITWKRESFDMSRTRTHFSKGRSRLTFTNVTKADSGEFTCVGQNGVGEEDTKAITLLVQHEPDIVRSDETPYLILSDRKVSARIACRAEGVPDISFQWMKEGVIIKEDSEELEQQVSRISPILWEGILTIKEVKTKDLGEYRCVARNTMGFDVTNFTLEADSSPDPPVAVRISNVSYDGMLIFWVPGFDGGHNVSFRVRYWSLESPDITMTVDVQPSNVTSTWIRGLKSNTEYSFNVMSVNVRGSSEYSTDNVKATTLPKPPNGKPKSHPDPVEDFSGTLSEILVTAVAVVFVSLLVLNMVLMACYYRRKRAKRRHSLSGTSSSSGSQSEEESSEDITLSDLSSKTTKQSSSPYSSTEFFDSGDKFTESYTTVTSITKSDSYSDWEKYSSYSEAHDTPVGFHV